MIFAPLGAGTWPTLVVANFGGQWQQVPVTPPIVADEQVWALFAGERLGIYSDRNGTPHLLVTQYKLTDRGYEEVQ